MRAIGRFIGASIVAVATIGVLVGFVVSLLLTPLWVFGEQDRARSAAYTGFTAAEVRIATGAILADLLVGPPDFDVEIRDQPVLNEAERGHLRDVRSTFLAFYAVVGVCLVIFIVARFVSHGSILFWRAVRAGSAILAVAVAAISGFVIVAFTVLFEVFHQLLFPPGSYTFNPATDRLVQLFPERFWFDTTIVLAIGLVVFSLGLRTLAGRRLATLRAAAAEAGTSSQDPSPEPPVGLPPSAPPTSPPSSGAEPVQT